MVSNKDELSADRLDPRAVSCVVLGAPRDRFSPAEIDALKAFVAAGGALAVFAADGTDVKTGGKELSSNVNQLLEDFGISVHADSVVRTVYYKCVARAPHRRSPRLVVVVSPSSD